MCNDIDQITNKIKEKMVQEGIMMISTISTTHQGYKLPRFFRIIPFNPELSQCDIDLILRKIVEYGNELE